MNHFDAIIRAKTLIKSSPEKIFETLTTAKGWDAWFTTGTEFDLKPQGKILFSWKDWGADKATLTARAEVIQIVRPERLSFHWNYGLQDGPTRVEFLIQKKGETTLLEVTESAYPDSKAGHKMFAECAVGWGEALTLLKIYLEHGVIYK